MPSPAQLMSGLLDYLVEQARDIDPNAFNLSKATEFKKTFADLGSLPWVDFNVETDADSWWLRVQRLEATRAPVLPEPDYAPFLVISDDPAATPPALKEAAFASMRNHDAGIDGEERAARRDEQRRARVTRVLDAYAPRWLDWAARERPRRLVIALYADLFALKTRLESEEAVRPLELVWGIGVSSWRIGTVDYHYPLVTQAIEIDIDDTTHAIGLRPRQLAPRLELDAFAACDVPGTGDVERAARALLRDRDELSPFDPASIEPILKLVAGNISANARYDAQADSAPAPGPELVVTHAWVVFARPRASHFLIEDIDRLKDSVTGAAGLPEGPLAIVSAPGGEVLEHAPIAFRGLSGRALARGEARELYFPLPYNREQETIIQQLERSPGVAVQGPPGTGKTHTIANIISHYLASGKRILVTSKGEPALKVLQEKIPPSIRPLSVALLSGDKEGMRQFQAAIEAIIHTLTHLNPAQEEERIATTRVALDRAHEEMARIDTRIDEIAHAQLADIVVDGVPMRAQKMSELVVEGRERFGWFDDELALSPEHAPPFGDEDGMRLREARRRLGPDLVYCQARIPDWRDLPVALEVEKLHGLLQAMR